MESNFEAQYSVALGEYVKLFLIKYRRPTRNVLNLISVGYRGMEVVLYIGK